MSVFLDSQRSFKTHTQNKQDFQRQPARNHGSRLGETEIQNLKNNNNNGNNNIELGRIKKK